MALLVKRCRTSRNLTAGAFFADLKCEFTTKKFCGFLFNISVTGMVALV